MTNDNVATDSVVSFLVLEKTEEAKVNDSRENHPAEEDIHNNSITCDFRDLLRSEPLFRFFWQLGELALSCSNLSNVPVAGVNLIDAEKRINNNLSLV